jgi:hypothetical protein
MNVGGFVNGKAQQPLPPAFVDHEAELYKFQKDCQALMNKILDLFAFGIEVYHPRPSNHLLNNDYFKSTRNWKAQSGSPIATAQNRAHALSAFSITHLFPQTQISNPQLIFEQELTLTTVLSLFSSKDQGNRVSRLSHRPLELPKETMAQLQHGLPFLSSRLAQKTTPVLRS